MCIIHANITTNNFEETTSIQSLKSLRIRSMKEVTNAWTPCMVVIFRDISGTHYNMKTENVYNVDINGFLPLKLHKQI